MRCRGSGGRAISDEAWVEAGGPRLEQVPARLRVVLGGVTVADTTSGLRVLETSHPPNYYFPCADILPEALSSEEGSSWCEWKGRSQYYTVRGGDRVVHHGSWGYARPEPAYRALAGTVAFYPARMDECWVDEDLARPQAGGFYGGWITSTVVGPFKGEPGTRLW